MAGIQTTILETLKQTCEWSPIPLLSNMAGLALSIYESAKVVQANKEAIRSLADSVVEISYIVIAGLQHEGRKGVQYTPKVESELRSLIGNLHSIEMYTKKHVDKRKWYSPYRGDRNAIADFRESLHCTLTNFGVSRFFCCLLIKRARAFVFPLESAHFCSLCAHLLGKARRGNRAKNPPR
ncbi:hypothetical protein AX16_010972 [Volvariella volvacea WC 439]|nr:hypothetical protein AX16_010972 [Volvariella volvacea WC 439]